MKDREQEARHRTSQATERIAKSSEPSLSAARRTRAWLLSGCPAVAFLAVLGSLFWGMRDGVPLPG